jgi:hypothetical protein
VLPSIKRSIWLLTLAGGLLAGCSASTPPPALPNLIPAEGSAPAPTVVISDPLPFVTPQAEQSAQFLPALENQSAAESAPTRPQSPLASPAALALPQISSGALLSATSTAMTPSSRKAIKAGLEASDPAAAQLASGKVQLIEFFAFW